MPDLTARQLALCVVAAAAALALGLSRLGADGPSAAPRSAPIAVQEDGAAGAERAVVHVAGAVQRPGVYRLVPGSRVAAALRRAGGPTRRADLAGLNLAAKVEDGRQVLVPERLRAGGQSTVASGTAGAQPLNLNTATLEQLDTLSGVGPETAQKILDFREERGGFGSIEELGEIPGIGDVRLATLRDEATL